MDTAAMLTYLTERRRALITETRAVEALIEKLKRGETVTQPVYTPVTETK